MGTLRVYDEPTVERAITLREKGIGLAAIARMLNMSIGAVAYHCLRLGAEVPNPRPLPGHEQGPRVMRRGNHVVRRFSPGEDRVLRQMDAAGYSRAAIARRLDRRRSSVMARLMILARHEEREAVAFDSAHHGADSHWIESTSEGSDGDESDRGRTSSLGWAADSPGRLSSVPGATPDG